MELIVLNILNGISFGVILFLLGSGLSLILGVMGTLNLAHGALYMVGAFVGWTVARQQGLNYVLAIISGGVVAGLIGLLMERGFLRSLYKQLNEQVLLTFGFLHILTNLSLWIWGPLPKAPFTAEILSSSFPIMGWEYPTTRIAIIFIGVALAVGLWWLQEKTRVGAIIRAGMDDKEILEALGINLGIVSTALFILGAFIAGASGVIGAQLFGVNLELGLNILLLALVVVIVGGTGSVQGALIGGIIIGLIISFGKALFPDLAMFFIYFVMIIILLIKPSGILGRKV